MCDNMKCCICGKKLEYSWFANYITAYGTNLHWCFDCDKKPESGKYKQLSKDNYKKRRLNEICKTCKNPIAPCSDKWIKIKLKAGIDYCIHYV